MSTAKFLRTKIGIFGRRNVGKSSIMNMLSNQNISIVSDVAGTTTDIVEKSIEIHGLGPALLLDTAGIDDIGELGAKRILRTKEAIEDIEIAILVIENQLFDSFEMDLIENFKKHSKPFLILINKCDLSKPKDEFLQKLNNYTCICTSAKTKLNIDKIYESLAEISEQNSAGSSDLFEGILSPNNIVLLVAPIDEEAPKDRLILPQVQAIRKILDNKAFAFVTSDSNVKDITFRIKPDLIVCDSQCVLEIVKTAPKDVDITTFSILMSRLKGDLREFVNGSKALDSLKDNDKILIAEACTHNAKDGDIARVKIPNLLKKFTKKNLEFFYTSGKEYPSNLDDFRLVIHCGGCMINKTTMHNRIKKATQNSIPITNYGIVISKCQGVLDRAISIFE